jgi:hypothetical protein
MPNFVELGHEFIVNLDLVTHVKFSDRAMKPSATIHFGGGGILVLARECDGPVRGRV